MSTQTRYLRSYPQEFFMHLLCQRGRAMARPALINPSQVVTTSTMSHYPALDDNRKMSATNNLSHIITTILLNFLTAHKYGNSTSYITKNVTSQVGPHPEGQSPGGPHSAGPRLEGGVGAAFSGLPSLWWQGTGDGGQAHVPDIDTCALCAHAPPHLTGPRAAGHNGDLLATARS